MAVFIAGAIIVFILVYNNTIDKDKFIADNEKYFEILREDDYNFLVYAKYGEDANPDKMFRNRVLYGFISGIAFLFALSSLSFINIVLSLVIGAVVFKSFYTQLKRNYKAHLHEIDILLPYYLKSLEVLVQHYTVPVALGKSIDDAPDIFKPGLRKLIERINAGDSTIDPYMEFANDYPVRDSMRMMRLLYRLGLGSQERKQERLMMFSRTVSNLQNKAREIKYKERLNHMENQTLIMLVVTGLGVMLMLLIAMLMMFDV
ncbi:MAG: hypothetical protein IJF92_04000 [Bacilli bacterium]|nr:hypothetical protein [Bacilli bacterium]